LPTIALVGFVLLVAALVVQSARLSWQTSLPARRLAAARDRGAEGERRAAPMLEAHGFVIVGAQVASTYDLVVDGERVPFDLRADYVVERGGRVYVAEVKTGAHAPRLRTAATRRQLLEYRTAFDVDGVLLVDADAGDVRLVEWPAPRPIRSVSAAVWLLIGTLVGALAGVLARGLLSGAG